MSTGSTPPATPAQPTRLTEVKIVDIDVPFDVLLRLAISAIPALFFAGLIISIVSGFVLGIGSVVLNALN